MNIEMAPVANTPEMIISHIQKMVLDGVLKPGEKLPSGRVLAEQFSVSRSSIKQTISLMEQRKIVKTRWNTGTVICDIFEHSLVEPLRDAVQNHQGLNLDAIEMRYILEVEVAMLAAKRRSMRDLEKIEASFQAMENASKSKNLITQVEADVQFHLAIANASHNRILIHIMSGMVELTRHNIFVNVQRVREQAHGQKKIHNEHKAIYQAILAGNEIAADKACRIHLRHAGHNLSEVYN